MTDPFFPFLEADPQEGPFSFVQASHAGFASPDHFQVVVVQAQLSEFLFLLLVFDSYQVGFLDLQDAGGALAELVRAVVFPADDGRQGIVRQAGVAAALVIQQENIGAFELFSQFFDKAPGVAVFFFQVLVAGPDFFFEIAAPGSAQLGDVKLQDIQDQPRFHHFRVPFPDLLHLVAEVLFHLPAAALGLVVSFDRKVG